MVVFVQLEIESRAQWVLSKDAAPELHLHLSLYILFLVILNSRVAEAVLKPLLKQLGLQVCANQDWLIILIH